MKLLKIVSRAPHSTDIQIVAPTQHTILYRCDNSDIYGMDTSGEWHLIYYARHIETAAELRELIHAIDMYKRVHDVEAGIIYRRPSDTGKVADLALASL